MKDEKCPYCGKNIIIVHSSLIYGKGHNYGLMKTCTDYPICDSYSGYRATLANRELRELRKRCHSIFDRQWISGKISRGSSYRWLQKTMNMSAREAHISMFRDQECKKLLSILEKNEKN